MKLVVWTTISKTWLHVHVSQRLQWEQEARRSTIGINPSQQHLSFLNIDMVSISEHAIQVWTSMLPLDTWIGSLSLQGNKEMPVEQINCNKALHSI